MMSLEKKVSFLIAGTQKGGTTALDEYLRMHPQICMANKKEVHFFDEDLYFKYTKVDYSIYHSFFDSMPNQPTILGEVTPIYMYWYTSPRRIWEYNPQMKIIIILRNPIERAYSHWNMERNRNSDSLPFWNAIQNERERCRQALPYQHRIFSYIDRGFYTNQIRRLWFFFQKKQIFILKTEELKLYPQNTIDRICEFLGVENIKITEPINIHSLPYISTMTTQEIKFLNFIYKYEIKELERLLKWDCQDWLAA